MGKKVFSIFFSSLQSYGSILFSSLQSYGSRASFMVGFSQIEFGILFINVRIVVDIDSIN